MSNSFDKNKYINRQASSWEISNRYKCLELIGKGSYGQVIKGIDKSTSSFVAIKKLEIMFDEPINAKRAYREVRILRHLNHPSIVKLNDIICPLLSESLSRSKKKNEEENSLYSYLQIPRNIGSVYLIFDYIDTDLSKIIKSNQFLSDEHIQFIIYQILDGLHYIHSANVIHRDLKPANILVSCTDCTIKIADFGLARVVSSEYLQKRSDSLTENGMSFDEDQLSLKSCSLDSNINNSNELHPESSLESNIPLPPVLKRSLTKHVVTRWYRAPEIILSQPYSSSVDLWSVGCILAELIIMLRESNIEYRKRRPLFPGDSCGDLSLDEDKFGFVQDLTKDGNKLEGNLSHEMMIELQKYQNQKCQLSIIFDVIGTPSIDEMTHFDKKTIDLVSSMRPKAKKDLKNIFPYARQECLDILEKLLQFNADKRITCVDGLNHRVFEGIKSQGYLSNYKNIPEVFSASQMWTPNDHYSTCKIPLCSEKEKVRESQLNLKHNFVQELLAFYKHSPLL